MKATKNRHRKSPLIAIGLVGLLALIGGAFAFNTDLISFDNLFMLDAHVATHVEEFTPPDPWTVCNEAPKTLITTNDSRHDMRVRLTYDEFWRTKDGETDLPLTKDGIRLAIINFQNEEDWTDGNDGWMYFKEPLKPGESTTSYFKSVLLNCEANFGGENICRQTETGVVCEKPENPYDESKYHLKITVQTTSEGFPEDDRCHVTVDPNGGLFNGSADIHEQIVRCGTNFDLRDIAYEEHELRDWTKNETDTFVGEEIRIDEDTTLIANWLSSIKYNVTVDPNGGSYADSAAPTSYEVRKGDTFTLGEATREGYFVEYWQIVGGDRLEEQSLVVLDNVTLQAHWAKTVARIERTQKLYGSIMSAHAAAQAGDTITLLVDTEEVVTNSKTVTLDLNEHTVVGSLTNTTSGNITLINGEIRNPSGIAVTNDGTLTIGIDDYKSDGSANIINDNIRLVGTTVGLEQTNDTYKFYFYDGYIEGIVGLQGGYDGAPFYRRSFDDTMVYYYPFVEHIENDEGGYQHVELKNADRAVTKTSQHGDIYYYNMQDNINVSAKTGYKIYAVRNFDASYPLSIREGITIDFELAGYEVAFSETATNNGVFNIMNSEGTGVITVWRSIINDGELSLTNVEMAAASSNALIINHNIIHGTNSELSSGYGVVILIEDNTITTLDLDENTVISSTSTSPAIMNNSTITISGGHIIGTSCGIRNVVAGTINITGGVVETVGDGTYTAVAIDSPINNYRSGTINISGGTIKGSGSAQRGINGGDIVMTGGSVVMDTPDVTGVLNYPLRVRMDDGLIRATSPNRVYGITQPHYGITMNGGTIDVNGGTSAYAITVYGDRTEEIYGGTITAHAGKNTAYGVYGPIDIYGGTITATSDNSEAYGVYYSRNTSSVINGGAIIYGDTYGILGENQTSVVTIGDNSDGELSTTAPTIGGGSYGIRTVNVNFYDGILKGGINAYYGSEIQAIPDAAELNIATIDGVENCWLITSSEYLEVDGTRYNSLSAAYNAVADGGTIKVIKDYSTAALMPTNPAGKTITIDLDGHNLVYTQTLNNRGTINFEDNSASQGGALTNDGVPVFYNDGGTLNVRSGSIYGYAIIINNTANSTVNVYGGKIQNRAGTGGQGAITSPTYGNTARVNILGGEVAGVDDSYSAIVGGIVTVDGGSITQQSTKYGAIAIYEASSVEVKSGLVRSASNSGSIHAIRNVGSITISGGRIEATDTSTSNSVGTTIAVSGKQSIGPTITGGEIYASSEKGNAYGVEYCATMTGGSITAVSSTKQASGIYAGRWCTTYIKGGTIYGGTYGISGSSVGVNVVIGEDDSEISITNPSIWGGTEALHDTSTSYYDGVLKGGDEAYQDGNIIAIPDAANQHIEEIDGVKNCWLIESASYLEVNGTRYNSLTKAYNAAASGDTIKVVEDFVTSAATPVNPAGKTIYFDINGHRLIYTQTLENKGTIYFIDSSADHDGRLTNTDSIVFKNTGGIFNMVSGNIVGSRITIYNDGNSTTNVSGGRIEANNAQSTEDGVIWSPRNNTNAAVNITGGELVGNGNSHTVITGGDVTVDGGSVIFDGTTQYGYAIYSVDELLIRGGRISASTSSDVRGIHTFRTATISGGTIEVTSTASRATAIDGNTNYCSTVTGGEIIAHSTNGQAAGVYNCTMVSGGTITATSDNGAGYGLYLTRYYGPGSSVTGGTIYGSTDGIHGENATLKLVIGSDDSTISSTSPSIRGESYGVYGTSMSFYDGILHGTVNAYQGNVVKTIADGAYIHIGRETIDGNEYDTRYLEEEHDIAKIGDVKYKSLKDAITAAETGDTIELLEDNHIFTELTIPSSKELTIDLKGNSIITGSQIINNGSTKITDTGSANPTIFYYDGTMFINNSNATLELNNLTINSSFVAENKVDGTLILDNVTILEASNTAITNSGNLVVRNNSSITSTLDKYSINHKGQSLQISDSILTNTYDANYTVNVVYISSGTTTIDNTQISVASYRDIQKGLYQYGSSSTTINDSTIAGLVNNAGPLTINRSQIIKDGTNAPSVMTLAANTTNVINNSVISSTTSNSNYVESAPRAVINNAGSLELNSSTLSMKITGSNNFQSRTLYNNGVAIMRGTTTVSVDAHEAVRDGLYGSAIYNEGTFTIESGSVVAHRTDSRGIHNNAGTITIKDVDVNVTGDMAYGIYVAGGTVIMGEAEPTNSADYGKATAHVSLTNPSIRATGATSGIGVKKTAGAFNYYDGIITANTAAEPEPPTNVEYLFEPATHTDGDSNQYVILEYMR